MRIGFDAKRAFCNSTGLGNYSRNIIRAMIRYYPQHEYVLFTPRITQHHFEKEMKGYAQVKIVQPGGLAAAWPSWWRTSGICKDIKAERLDVYHGLSNELPRGISSAGVRSVVTLHDLIPFKDASFHVPLDRWIYQWKMRRSVREADTVVCISRQTAADAEHFLHPAAGKLHVVYQPVNPEFLQEITAEQIKAVRYKHQLPPRYMLHVGRIELRKNLYTVLLAMTEMGQRSDIHLVSVGRKTGFYSSIHSYVHNFGLTKRVHFLEEVSPEDLPAIMKGAVMVVYPSLMEGFGLPVAEALALEVPVVTTRGGCFEEAGDDVAFYSEPENTAGLAERILEVDQHRGSLQERLTNGRIHIQKFAAETIAADLHTLYTAKA